MEPLMVTEDSADPHGLELVKWSFSSVHGYRLGSCLRDLLLVVHARLSVLEGAETNPSVKGLGVSPAQPPQVDGLEFLADDEHAVLGVRNHREAHNTRALILWR